MRKHMTQGEMIRIQKLLRNGVDDIGEIQKHVFIHESCIQKVIDKFNGANANASEAAPPKKKAARRRRVDPIS